MTGPTPKQRRFALRVVEGMSPSEAYRDSYEAGGMSPASVSREAYGLMRNPNITPLLREGFSKAMKDAAWCRATAIEHLEKVNRVCLEAITNGGGQVDRSALAGFLETTDRLNKLCFVPVETADARDEFMANPERLKRTQDASKRINESVLASMR